MSHSTGKTTQVTQMQSTPVSLQDTKGVTIAGNSGSNINVTDGGAVHDAFSFMEKTDAATTQRLGMMLDAGKVALDTFSQNAQQTGAAITDAFKQQNSPNRDILLVGLVSVGLIGVTFAMRK